MPQSLSRMLVHLIFSTKNREPFIVTPICSELHAYLGGTLTEIDCPVLKIGGVEDHVHMLFGLSRTRTIASVVETIKAVLQNGSKPKGTISRRFIGRPDTAYFPLANRMRAPSLSTSPAKRNITAG